MDKNVGHMRLQPPFPGRKAGATLVVPPGGLAGLGLDLRLLSPSRDANPPAPHLEGKLVRVGGNRGCARCGFAAPEGNFLAVPASPDGVQNRGSHPHWLAGPSVNSL